MKICVQFVCLLWLLGLTQAESFACVCGRIGSKPEQVRKQMQWEAERAEAIFVGEVIALDRLTAKFKVSTVWKGETQNEITMTTGVKVTRDGYYTSSSCDYNFTPGGKYLVYARLIEGLLHASHCSGTSILIPETTKEIETRVALLNEWQRKEKAKKRLPARKP